MTTESRYVASPGEMTWGVSAPQETIEAIQTFIRSLP